MTGYYDPLQDGKSRLELISVMGSDLEIVNDARVSYNRESKEFNDRDRKLLKFLLYPPDGKPHTSPFRGSVMKFEVKAPLAISRQWWKHHVASCYTEEQDGWNEQSFRYTQIDEADFYLPKVFCKQSTANKQKASEETVIDSKRFYLAATTELVRCGNLYNEMVSAGIAREQARLVLPAAFYTKFRWTASLLTILNFLDLRSGHGAQEEIAQYARCIEIEIADHFPETYDLWRKNK